MVIFKPKIVEDFIVEKDDSDWNEAKINKILELQKQIHLFPIDQDLAEFKVVRKLPYKFKFKFKDSLDKTSTLMIEDWEIGQLYWNCVKKYGEQKGIQKVREKYFDDFAMKKDLYFFLGTTFKWHKLRARNPFVIIGTFHPPNVSQLQLF